MNLVYPHPQRSIGLVLPTVQPRHVGDERRIRRSAPESRAAEPRGAADLRWVNLAYLPRVQGSANRIHPQPGPGISDRQSSDARRRDDRAYAGGYGPANGNGAEDAGSP